MIYIKKCIPVLLILLFMANCFAKQPANTKPIAVIFDTDIGSDIDDIWALAMLLNSPELDIRLITTSTGDVIYRAKLVAKMLELAGRTEIPIGIGSSKASGSVDFRQYQWVDGYDLKNYAGKVYNDGVRAMADTVMSCEDKIKIIAVGPASTVAEALELEPAIAKKAEFVGMYGDIANPKHNEYNVKRNISGIRKVFASDWQKTITPLDTCGDIVLSGERYKKFCNRHSKLTDAITEAYRQWYKVQHWIDAEKMNPDKSSSILYDTVAVYLAFAEDLVEIENMPLSVNKRGAMTIDKENGNNIRVAIRWKNKEAYLDFLLARLIK